MAPEWGALLTGLRKVHPCTKRHLTIKRQYRCNGLSGSELEVFTNKKKPSKYQGSTTSPILGRKILEELVPYMGGAP